MLRGFKILASLRILRGTPLDVFGYHPERRAERKLVQSYSQDVDWALNQICDANRQDVIELLTLPMTIRGFGPVKMEALEKAFKQREILRKSILDKAKSLAHAAQ